MNNLRLAGAGLAASVLLVPSLSAAEPQKSYAYFAYMYVRDSPVPNAHILLRGSATGATPSHAMTNLVTLMTDPEAEITQEGPGLVFTHGDLRVTLEMEGTYVEWYPLVRGFPEALTRADMSASK